MINMFINNQNMDRLRKLKIEPNSSESSERYKESHWYGSYYPAESTKLFSWGSNSHGQLGQGLNSPEQFLEPRNIDLSLNNKKIDPKNIKYITGGGGHTFIIDKLGRVYACGNNCSGQLGIPDCDKINIFTLVKSLLSHTILDISCGWDSSAALTKYGEVLVWGSNKFNQLGMPNILTKTDIPTLLTTNARCVSMGLRHTAVIYNDYRIAVAGCGQKGQLGMLDGLRKPLRTSSSLQHLQLGEKPGRKIVCGQHHTLVLDTRGTVWGFGDNRHGQIDISDEKEYPTPVRIKILKTAQKNIWAGWTHSAALSEKNVLTLWGRNNYGQLTKDVIDNKAVIKDITDVALGSEHCLAIDSDGKLLTWGWNEHGNCGTGDEENVLTPACLGGTCISIGTGYGASYAIMDNFVK